MPCQWFSYIELQKKVWAKWVTVDDVIAEKLGFDSTEGQEWPKEILIEVGHPEEVGEIAENLA